MIASSGRLASRAPSARAWAVPRSSSGMPGVHPDRVWPVAAVRPWRTSRTVVTCPTLAGTGGAPAALTGAGDEHRGAEHHVVTGLDRHRLADPPAVHPGAVGGPGGGQPPTVRPPV